MHNPWTFLHRVPPPNLPRDKTPDFGQHECPHYHFAQPPAFALRQSLFYMHLPVFCFNLPISHFRFFKCFRASFRAFSRSMTYAVSPEVFS